jgi:hypothetical protein
VLAERIDTLGTVLEARGLLKSLDDSDLVFTFGAGDIRVFANDGRRICVALYRRGKFVEMVLLVAVMPERLAAATCPRVGGAPGA